MRKASLILWFLLAVLLLVSPESFSWVDICIDPGHGGTDAGCIGRVYGVQEKDVNLGVGLKLYHYFGLANWEPIMTRYEDIYMLREARADSANKANYELGVDAFISIHHNATRDTVPPDTITNGTETFWCNVDTADSGWERDTTDSLASKVYYKLLDKFHYHPLSI